ncbi:MAG: glycosyltransferase family 9 protein [Bacteroides sp.]|nr:glycosyltransferase family 9 protein [Roseburia sp.]MCM1345818.1 glycosyltransferase family 9 protein [Bacteroides sp.]MCM1421283.1 glycosyltransferase family 9 protein [Bacteroides sp.]
MTLLIIRLSALGDVAMTVPAIYAVAREYPDWTVKVLTTRFFARIFVGKPDNVKLLAVDRDKMKGFTGLLRLIRTLKKEHVTCVADFHNVFRSWLIDAYFIMTGHKVTMVDKDRQNRKKLTRKHETGICAKSFCLRYFETLQRLGFNVDAKSVLPSKHKTGSGNTQRIGIAPFARYQNKTYPLDKMREVVDILSGIENTEIYLFGSKGKEQTLLEDWAYRHSHVRCMAGTLPIEEEIQFMATLDVMLTMDSANMHLASLAGTPVVSVWGSTTPECGFLGWRQERSNCLVAGLPCQPCTISGSNRCKYGNYLCLTSITPSQICRHLHSVVTTNKRQKT